MRVAVRSLGGGGYERGGALPLFLAVLFLVAGLLLYVTSTIPAQREQTFLRGKHAELAGIKDRLEVLLGSFRGREHAMEEDLETLLVEIDSLNLVPEDLLPDVHMSKPAPPAPAQKPKKNAGPAPESTPLPPGRPRSFSGGEPSKRH